jgi:hypothetical protein
MNEHEHHLTGLAQRRIIHVGVGCWYTTRLGAATSGVCVDCCSAASEVFVVGTTNAVFPIAASRLKRW